MKSKNEFKDAYKEMKFQIGVFQIRNTVNSKIYIESSTDLVLNRNRHGLQLNSGLHPNVNLQKAWNEIGQGCFKCEILSEIKQGDKKTADYYYKEAKQPEIMFIEDLQPFANKGYNL